MHIGVFNLPSNGTEPRDKEQKEKVYIFICIYIFLDTMSSKNIAITKDLYDVLSRNKVGDESFTDVIYRIMDERKRPSRFFGAWADLSPEEERTLEESRMELRKAFFERRKE